MNWRLAAVGALVAVVGLVAVVRPDVVAGLPVSFSVVTAVGALSLLQAVRVGLDRYRRDAGVASLPAVERRVRATVPGRRFDDALEDADSRVAGPQRQRDLREELQSLAVATLVRYDGLTPEHARERLRAGTWTDDPFAAAFFAPAPSTRLSWQDRLRARAAGDTAFTRGARQVVTVLDRRITAGAGGDPVTVTTETDTDEAADAGTAATWRQRLSREHLRDRASDAETDAEADADPAPDVAPTAEASTPSRARSTSAPGSNSDSDSDSELNLDSDAGAGADAGTDRGADATRREEAGR